VKYDIYAKGEALKGWNDLKNCLSSEEYKRMENRLTKSPFPSNNEPDELNSVVKLKHNHYRYAPTGGDRILYLINKKKAAILIVYAGNHDGYLRFKKLFDL